MQNFAVASTRVHSTNASRCGIKDAPPMAKSLTGDLAVRRPMSSTAANIDICKILRLHPYEYFVPMLPHMELDMRHQWPNL